MCNVSVSLPCVPSDGFLLVYLHVEWVSRSHPYLVSFPLYTITPSYILVFIHLLVYIRLRAFAGACVFAHFAFIACMRVHIF